LATVAMATSLFEYSASAAVALVQEHEKAIIKVINSRGMML